MRTASLKEISILSSCIDIGKLARDETYLLSFDTLSLGEKLGLLAADFEFCKGIIKPEDFSPSDRVAAIKINPKNINRYPITDPELHKLNGRDYLDLLSFDFKKFIRADVFNKLTSTAQAEVFLKNPEWVYENTEFKPVFTRYLLDQLVSSNISFLQKHIEDITIQKSSSWFWETMFEYNESNYGVFLKNIQSIPTKTETRTIFKQWPRLVTLLTIDIMRKSNLDGREWVLLIESLVNKHEYLFEGWSLSEDIRADLSLDITAILISGQHKLSKRLSNSIKYTIK